MAKKDSKKTSKSNHTQKTNDTKETKETKPTNESELQREQHESGSPGSPLTKLLFASRWLLVPIYTGMILMLMVLVWKFFEEIFHILPGVNSFTEKELMVSILSLIDLSLVANLILIVMFNGYESFVEKIETRGVQKMDWMGKVGFSTLKVKLISSIIIIASVDLLKIFINIKSYSEHDLKWRLIIYVAFLLAGIALTWMDRLYRSTSK